MLWAQLHVKLVYIRFLFFSYCRRSRNNATYVVCPFACEISFYQVRLSGSSPKNLYTGPILRFWIAEVGGLHFLLCFYSLYFSQCISKLILASLFMSYKEGGFALGFVCFYQGQCSLPTRTSLEHSAYLSYLIGREAGQ